MFNYNQNKIRQGFASVFLILMLFIFSGYSPAPAGRILIPAPEPEVVAYGGPEGVSIPELEITAFAENEVDIVPEEAADDEIYEVFVVQQRWHTGIIFRTRDVDPDIWPEIKRYTDRNYVDVGWGDERFYQAMGDPVGLALRSMLFPTRSVLLVYPFNLPLHRTYGRDARIIRIPLNSEQFRALTRFVSDRFMRDEAGNIRPSTIHGVSDLFFLAHGKYHVFNTCNTWVARGFQAAGFRIRRRCVLNANQVFKQMERIPGSEYLRE
jgi:uncharacterized protein (TIGR02117 family)